MIKEKTLSPVSALIRANVGTQGLNRIFLWHLITVGTYGYYEKETPPKHRKGNRETRDY